MEVAVIILNWNGLELMKSYLPTVVAQTPAEIATVIVADNGSTDGSVEWLRAEHPEVELIVFGENYGFAEGYNRAIRAIAPRFRYSVLLNRDVMVNDDWMSPLYRFMESHPEA